MPHSLMLQGTMSNAGKSFLTAALCRIFLQDGHSPAPFKSQNMALNSFITADSLEMGRAQAMQAEAAGIAPDVRMNPVLLKPTTDTGSQVIVNGKVRGDMRAAAYFRQKKALLPEILAAYESLSREHDILVIEGAGSPVELNLKADDIVNMGLALQVKSPVLLVGDIDRGGIFAQLLGTLMLLEPEERALVKGLIVNRFRGDPKLFADGIRILEEKSGIPVLGVVPYLHVDIEDEDSLSDKLHGTAPGKPDIAVIALPKLSNYTDFDAFLQYEGAAVRYVRRPHDLGTPDLVIVPGTKSTIADMRWLRESGMETAVKRLAANGTPVFGICGGYQILGEEISDPLGSEGGGTIPGMGLLPCKTVFAAEKHRSQVSGRFAQLPGFWSCLSGAAYEGYEIHMGETTGTGTPLTEAGGFCEGNVCGCYVHGIFDTAEVSGRLMQALLQTEVPAIDRKAYKEQQFDLLAAGVRKSLDMDKIYQIIEEGIHGDLF
ncbi:MAG: cobyric acid synthase [Oscillospiraceae bacterium]|nr:cobyric acid synthase [Oscillospiraceae bacterium]